jgi:hypothetical protein
MGIMEFLVALEVGSISACSDPAGLGRFPQLTRWKVDRMVNHAAVDNACLEARIRIAKGCNGCHDTVAGVR